MKMKHLFSAVLLAALSLLVPLAGVWADVYLESEQVSQGMPGDPKDVTSTTKYYVTQDATRTDMVDRIIIVDLKGKVFYDLDPAAKTYIKSSIESMGMSDEEAKQMADNPMFKAMMKSMSQGAKVTPTSETKKIAGYNCKKYLVTIMMAQSDYWVSKEVKGMDEMRAVGEKTAKLFEGNPVMQQSNIMGMLKELDGYPVQTITKMMGGSVVTTLKKVETKKIDKALFKVPKGYKLVAED